MEKEKKWENIDMENKTVVEATFRSINVCSLVLFCLTERTRRGTQQIMLVQYIVICLCLYVSGETIVPKVGECRECFVTRNSRRRISMASAT